MTVLPSRWLRTARSALPRRRLYQAATSVADQGLISIGTFLLNVLLARTVLPEEYGTFVLAYSGALLTVEVQNALVLEPLMVFGSATRDEVRDRYLSAALVLQTLFTLGIMTLVGLLILGWALGQPRDTGFATVTMMGVGIAGIHFREFTRKVFFTCFDPGGALRNDSLYLAMLLAGVTALLWLDALSGATTFGLLALAGLVSSGIGLLRVGVRLSISRPHLRAAADRHWQYGRWMIGVSGARWSANELYYFVAAAFLGPAGSGALKAVQNVYAPVSLFLAGLGNLLLPVTAGLVGQARTATLNRFVVGTGVLLGGGVLVYALGVTLGADTVFGILYEGGYRRYAYLLPLLGIGQILVAAFQGPSLALRALQRTRAIFFITTVSASVTVLSVIPLTARWALPGAVTAMLLGLAVSSPLWAVSYLKALRTRGASAN